MYMYMIVHGLAKYGWGFNTFTYVRAIITTGCLPPGCGNCLTFELQMRKENNDPDALLLQYISPSIKNLLNLPIADN